MNILRNQIVQLAAAFLFFGLVAHLLANAFGYAALG